MVQDIQDVRPLLSHHEVTDKPPTAETPSSSQNELKASAAPLGKCGGVEIPGRWLPPRVCGGRICEARAQESVAGGQHRLWLCTAVEDSPGSGSSAHQGAGQGQSSLPQETRSSVTHTARCGQVPGS